MERKDAVAQCRRFWQRLRATRQPACEGARVFVQDELPTREYDRTIKIPASKAKSVDHAVQQLVVELRADIIRILDRSNVEQSDAAERAEADLARFKRLVKRRRRFRAEEALLKLSSPAEEHMQDLQVLVLRPGM